MTGFGYSAPHSLDEAVTLLANNADARVLAGGQTLLVEPNRSRLATSLLVDLRKIEGLSNIERQQDGSVKIGAMTALATIARDGLIRETHPVLAEAMQTVGDAQERNRATIGGSLADADPSGDLPALMLALGTQLQIVGPQGSRTVLADDLITGANKKALRTAEVITAVTLPAATGGTGAAYERFAHPATLHALCGVASSVTLDGNGSVSDCRVAITGAADRAARLHSVEDSLKGKRPTPAALAAAASHAGDGLAFRTDLFASAEYRAHLAQVLTERVLAQAVGRAGHQKVSGK